MTTVSALTCDARPSVGLPAEPLQPGDPLTIGFVSYLNTLPLVGGLERVEGLRLAPTVPADQVGLLESRRVDVALCSVVDLVRSSAPLCVLPVGMLGCEGPTLTVRLFSRCPLDRLTEVHCDCDSHTSVRLLSVLLRETEGIEPRIRTFDPRSEFDVTRAEAFLLIGDKVMNNTLPLEFQEHQLDLGEAWFTLTGEPFVFATWMCRQDGSEEAKGRVRRIATLLDRTRRRNRHRINQFALEHSDRFKWDSPGTARGYLEDLLRFDFTEEARRGMTRFLRLSEGFEGEIPVFDWN